MDFEDILYFDYKSGDDITLNLQIMGRFLWYTNVTAPVFFSFKDRRLDIKVERCFIRIGETSVSIFLDYEPEEAPTSLTTLDITRAEYERIREGVNDLLGLNVNDSVEQRTFRFDPEVLRL